MIDDGRTYHGGEKKPRRKAGKEKQEKNVVVEIASLIFTGNLCSSICTGMGVTVGEQSLGEIVLFNKQV